MKVKFPGKKFLNNRKRTVVVLTTALLTVFAVGGSLALLQARTNTKENNFKYGLVNVVPEEHFEPGDIREGEVVKQLRIKNSRTDSKGEGDLNIVPAYVRVKLVASWVKEGEQGENPVIVPFDPAPYICYGLNLNSENASELTQSTDVDGDWVKGDDGCYYFTKPVEPDAYTDYLLETVSLSDSAVLPQAAEGGYLQIDVLVDAEQASSPDAVKQAWGNPTVESVSIY